VGDVLERVSIFRAVFDNADRMSGIFVATSKDDQNYKARHSNKKEQEKEERQEEETEERT
jgi:ribosomal protein L12E/L44/L45/RPP1/RPP2